MLTPTSSFPIFKRCSLACFMVKWLALWYNMRTKANEVKPHSLQSDICILPSTVCLSDAFPRDFCFGGFSTYLKGQGRSTKCAQWKFRGRAKISITWVLDIHGKTKPLLRRNLYQHGKKIKKERISAWQKKIILSHKEYFIAFLGITVYLL